MDEPMKCVVKRAGHTEIYDERKLYASVYAAMRAVREPAGTAELVAKEVESKVQNWLEHKHEVTSNDLRRVAAEHLRNINPGAAFIYKHHRVVW